MFVVLKPLRYVEQTSDIETGELMCFVGDRFIVTVRRGEAAPLAGLRKRLEDDPERAAARARWRCCTRSSTPSSTTTRSSTARSSADLDEIETAVFSGADMDSSTIYRLKREVLEFRRAAAPLAAPLHGAARGRGLARHRPPSCACGSATCPTTCRPSSTTSSPTTGCSPTSLGAHLAQITVQQNNDMRRISAWVAIAAVPTMIAGIYGMNFDYMPELTASIRFGDSEFQYGYFVVLAVMAGACIGLFRAFKRSGWL